MFGRVLRGGHAVQLGGVGEQVADQPVVAVRIGQRHRHGLIHRRMLFQRGFDFAQFDAVAAHLHLEVDAAEEFDVAVGQIAGKIAGTVNSPIPERVWNEPIRREVGAIPIAMRDAIAADAQFAGYADGHRLHGFVHDIGRGVEDRCADGRVAVGIALAPISGG